MTNSSVQATITNMILVLKNRQLQGTFFVHIQQLRYHETFPKKIEHRDEGHVWRERSERKCENAFTYNTRLSSRDEILFDPKFDEDQEDAHYSIFPTIVR